jgi:hypothetical protein
MWRLLLTIILVSLITPGMNNDLFWNQAGPVIWSYTCDFKVGKLIKGVQSTPDKCGPICESTCNCTHFTYTKYSNGTCWLRNGQVIEKNAFKTTSEGSICGIFRGNNNCDESKNIYWNVAGNVKWGFACNFNGRDLKGISSKSDKCGPLCEKTCNCTHFTYTPAKSTCWLKKGAIQESDAKKEISYGMICGYIWRDIERSC